MKRSLTLGMISLISLTHTWVIAATPDVSIANTVTQSITLAANGLMSQAIIWLSSLIALQFIITNFNVLKSGGDIEAVMAKFIGSMAWFSFCFYVLANGPDFIDSVGNGILTKFAPNIPSPGSIIESTLAMCTTFMFAIVVTGTSVVGTGNSAVANVLVISMFFIFSVGMYMAIKILMLSLELALIVMLAPLSFSLLGLNALKDQGIAPLKSLISLIYRIILLGIICASFSRVSQVAGTQLTSVDWTNPTDWGKALTVVMSMLVSFPVLVYLVYKSDSIASSLAGGSTSMGPGDVATAAAAGAAAGAAVATGGASTVGATGRAAQGMGDVIKSILGGGSISNASSSGFGGQAAAGEAPRRSASMSLPSAQGQGSGAPTRTNQLQGGMVQLPSRSSSIASTDAAPIRSAGGLNDVSSNATVASEKRAAGSEMSGSTSAPTETRSDRGTANNFEAATRSGENQNIFASPPSQAQAGANIDAAPMRSTANLDQASSNPNSLSTKSGAGSAERGMSSPVTESAPRDRTSTGDANAAPTRQGVQVDAGTSQPPKQELGAKPADLPPVRPPQSDHSRAPVRPGSGANAGISGASTSQGVPQEPSPSRSSAWEKLGKANKHLAQEQAATHVTINTHHSD